MKIIENFPDYAVTLSGEVWSLRYDRQLKPQMGSGGYLAMGLCRESQAYTKRIHRLVAEAFLPNPDKLPEVNHIDEDKTNNHVSNLEWCTKQHNVEHSHARWHMFVSPEGERVEIYNLSKFCRDNELNLGHMQNVASGRRRTHKGWTAYA